MQLFTKPAEGTLKFAVILLIAVMIPSSIASAIGGNYAGMAFGIAAGFTMAVTPFATTSQAFGSGVLAAALAAVSTLAGSTPWAVAALMLFTSLLLGVTNMHSAGLMTLAPAIVVIFGPSALDLSWQASFGYVLAGGLVGMVIIRLFSFEAEPQPVDSGVAWRHAIVLGVLSAGAMYWALANDVSHGYWVAVTLVMALRPLPEQRASTLWGRLLGTLLGAVIAFAAIAILPIGLAALVAAVSLLLLAAYSMSGNYFMQTLFLTPMLLIFATLGDAEKGLLYTTERVYYTIVGVVIGAVAAILLDAWDRAVLRRGAAEGLAAHP
jgi:hypothetical protein